MEFSVTAALETFVDTSRKDFWNNMFRKRPDEDRDKKQTFACELPSPPFRCKCSNRSLFCENQDFILVPKQLPSNLVELDLSGNFIPTLEKQDFPRLNKINTIILISTDIIHLGKDVFGNLPTLQTVHLSGNKISELQNYTFGTSRRLEILIISHNPIKNIATGAFLGLDNLRELDIRTCYIKFICPETFAPLVNLTKLLLDQNEIQFLPAGSFEHLRNLLILSLSSNIIEEIDAQSFRGLVHLISLNLGTNQLRCLDAGSFIHLKSLLILDLSDNKIHSLEADTFKKNPGLKSLNLKNNQLRQISRQLFANLSSLSHIYFDEFHLCSYAPNVRICYPRGDGISSIAHLLENEVLRVSVWVVATLACCGNLFVLIGRMAIKESNNVHSFFIRNLSAADFIMGVYLFIIAGYDMNFRGHYIEFEYRWRHSWQCKTCGFLCTLSSEVSVFILAVITTDRYISVIHPMSTRNRSISLAFGCMLAVWGLGVFFAAIPLLNVNYFGEEFYGNNGVCLPLHIHNPYAEGWEFTMILFCGVNTLVFVFILYAYKQMFYSISKSNSGLRSTIHSQNKTIAKRFAFIVGTNCLCWIPIVVAKCLTFSGVPIDDKFYGWVAVFLLPVNSALNPVLYTLTTKHFCQHFDKYVRSIKKLPTPAKPLDDSALSAFLNGRNRQIPMITFYSEDDHTSRSRSSLLSLNNRTGSRSRRNSSAQKNPQDRRSSPSQQNPHYTNRIFV
ncbi:uncharacterized protein LOC143257258 isoform X2 [Tachypleus tridentatus]|uniref:uncharacterized protein LOC143257258 isoform X2 n=1 Tax=Tachypleus tridentatus TaxID=6853 RepID=UPI003FCF6832